MKYKILALSISLSSLLFSCSDDSMNDPNGWNDNPGGTEQTADNVGYLAIKINMSDKGAKSRAGENPVYAEGTEREKRLDYFDILIFSSPTPLTTAEEELTAKFEGYATNDENKMDDVEGEYIDNKTVYIAMIDDLLGTRLKNKDDVENNSLYYYAYIVANHTAAVQKKTNYLNISTFGDLYDKTIETHEHAVSVALTNPARMVMSSAPKWQTDGKDPLQLVSLDLDQIQWFPKGTIVKENMITKDYAAIFFLQRNVAKITTSEFDECDEYDADLNQWHKYYEIEVIETEGFDNTENEDDLVDLNWWGFRCANPESYIVQHTMGIQDAINGITNTGRFFDVNSTFSRCFWAFDPNYEVEDGSPEQWHQINREIYPTEAEYTTSDYPLYVYENTMSTENMKQNQTTLVMFCGNYYVGGKKMLEEGKDLTYTPFIMFPGNKRVYTIERLMQEVHGQISDVNPENGLSFKTGDDRGSHQNTFINLEGILNLDNVGETTYEDIAELFGISSTDYVIADYTFWDVSGMRFTVPIRHFTDDQIGHEFDIEDVYKGWNPYTQEHLGRFGVLRNHWYDISIDGFTGPSYYKMHSDIPDIPDDPYKDDETAVIKCTINVLSWVKHSQGAVF